MNDVETEIGVPVCRHDDGDDEVDTRVICHVLGPDDVSYDAAMQLFGDDATSPEAFADAVLRTALAVAALRGSAYSWATQQRLAAYDGMPPK